MASKKEFKVGIILSGDGKGSVKAIEATKSELKQLDKQSRTSTRMARDLARIQKDVARQASAAGKALGVLGVASTAVLSLIVKQSFETADALGKVGDRLGIGTEQLAGLQKAAEFSGVNVSTLNMGLQRMTRRVAEAAQGTGEARGALKELGLSAAELSRLSPDEQFNRIAQAMSGVGSQSDRVRLAMKLFDSEGVALLNTLDMGSDQIRQITEEMEALNVALSREEVGAIEAANDSITRMQSVTQGLGNTIAVQVAPFITDIANRFYDASVESNGFQEQVLSGMESVAKGVGFVGNAVRGVQVVFKGLEIGALGATSLIANTFVTLNNSVEAIINSTIDEINGLINAINAIPGIDIQPVARIDYSVMDWFAEVEQFAQGSIEMVREAGQELHELATQPLPSDSIEKWFKNARTQALETSGTMQKTLGNELPGAIGQTGDAAKEMDAVLSGLFKEIEVTFDSALYFWGQQERGAKQAAETIRDELDGLFGDTERIFDAALESWEEQEKASEKVGSALADAIDQARVGFEEFDGPFRQSIDRMLDSIKTFDRASRESGEEQTQSRLKGFAQMSSALAGMASEGSSAYQVLTVAANAAAVANAIAAIANQGFGDPYTAFARIAAMASMMASLGIQVGIGGGGGSVAVGALDAVGTNASGIATRGTVLGDTDAESESFLNALDAIETTLDAGLDIDRRQLTALRNIEVALGAVSSQFAQFASIGGYQSLTFGGTIGDVQQVGSFSNGAPSGAFGLQPIVDYVLDFTDRVNEASPAITRAIQSVFSNMGAALGDAVQTLGGDAEAAISQFLALDLGSLIIGEGQDIDEVISALFAAVGDSAFAVIADQLDIDLSRFQQIGEGAAETLFRLSVQMQALQDVSNTLGVSLDGLTAGSTLEIADALAQQAGGVDELAENISELFDVLLTDQQQLARQSGILSDALADAGLAMPATRDELRGLVQGLDLTTQSGRETFTLLSELAPAFGDLFDELQDVRDAAYDVRTALGLEDGLRDVRDALASVGLTIDDITRAAAAARDNGLDPITNGLGNLLGGLNDAELAGLEPFINQILNLVPAAGQAGIAISGLAQRLQGQILSVERQIATVGLSGSALSQAQAGFSLEDNLSDAEGDQDAIDAARELYQLQLNLIAAQEAQAAAAARNAAAQQAAQQAALAAQQAAQAAAAELQQQQQALAQFAVSFASRVGGYGLSGVDAALFTLDQTFNGFRVQAEELGFDLNEIEAQYARERTDIIKQFNEEALALEQQRADALLDFSLSFDQRVSGFGLDGLAAALFSLDQEFDRLRDQALEVGFDITVIEDQYGRERLEIIAQYNQEALTAERNARAQSLRDQISGLEQIKRVAESLRSFVSDELQSETLGTGNSLARAQQAFFRTANAARGGDLDAASQIPGAGRSVIEAALQSARSETEFNRIRGTVLGAASTIANGLEIQVTELDVLESQLSVLEDIRDALVQPETGATTGPSPGGVNYGVGSGPGGLFTGYNTEPFTPPNGLSDAKFRTLLENGVDPYDPNALIRAGGPTVAEYALIPGFARGGDFPGGLRVVGEQGPELEFTGPSRILSNANSGNLLSNANKGIEDRLERLERILVQSHQVQFNTARAVIESQDILEQWDDDGLPAERAAA